MWVQTMKACLSLVNRRASSTPNRLASSGVISPGTKGLPQVVGNHIVRTAHPAGAGGVGLLVQQELGVGHAAVALVAGDEPAVVGLLMGWPHSQ